jgi:AcrR family transcriptional regulator
MPKLSPGRTAERRALILDAALICFAEHGFYKTTMQDVATSAGLSIGALYCHFAGKDEVIHALIEARHRRDLELIAASLSAASLRQGLESLVLAFFPARPSRADRAWRRVAVQLWAEALHDAPLLAVALNGLRQPKQMLIQLFAAAQSRGELAEVADPATAAAILIAAFQGMSLQQSWGEAIATHRLSETICHWLVRSVGSTKESKNLLS